MLVAASRAASRRRLVRESGHPAPSRAAAAKGVTPAAVEAFLATAWPEASVGIKCHEISGTHVLMSQKVLPGALRPGGYVSGPNQFALADLGMWAMSWAHAGFEAMALTSELSIRFLRPAIGQTLWARIDCNSAGSRTIVSTATLWATDGDAHDDLGDAIAASKPCSVAQGTYVLPRG